MKTYERFKRISGIAGTTGPFYWFLTSVYQIFDIRTNVKGTKHTHMLAKK